MRMATGAVFESLFFDRMIQSPFAAARSPKSALPGPWYTSPTRHSRPENQTESSGARIRTRPPLAPRHPPAIPNRGRGVVCEVVYVGDATRYRVAVATAGTLTIKIQNRLAFRPYAVGDPVELAWDPSQTRLFQDGR